MSDLIFFFAMIFGGIAFLAIMGYFLYKGLKKRDQELIEAVINETEDLDEEVLGRIRVLNLPKFSPLGEMPLTHEVLVITANSVLVKKIAEEHAPSFPGSGIILDDAARYVKKRRKSEPDKSFVILNSEITRVRLNKFGWRGRKAKLHILTSGQEFKWIGNGIVLPEGWKKDAKLEDYENLLRLAFPDKLSVKK